MVANCDHLSNLKYSKALPYAFTEHGAIMAASVLNSPRAVEVSVFIVRAFVKLRRAIAEHRELAAKIAQLEQRLADHDELILTLVEAIDQFVNPELPQRQMVLYSRIVVTLLGVVAFVQVRFFERVLEMAIYAYTMYGVGITPAVMAAFFWKRATAAGGV